MQDGEECRPEGRQWLGDNRVGEFAALKGRGGPGREDEAYEKRRAWNQHLAAAGLTCLGWPVEHGGRGLSVAHAVAFTAGVAPPEEPPKVDNFGDDMLGPTRTASGTAAKPPRILPTLTPLPHHTPHATP